MPTAASTIYASPTPLPEIVDVTISAVGDIMVHQAQLDDAYDPNTGTYDFTHNFAEIAPSLMKSDLVIGSILTTFAGERIWVFGNAAFQHAGFDANRFGGSGV